MREITLSSGRRLLLKPWPVKHFKGTRLPGAELFRIQEDGVDVSCHIYQNELFHLCLWQFSFTRQSSFKIAQGSNRLRMQALLRGALEHRSVEEGITKMETGEYHFSKGFPSEFSMAASFCELFVLEVGEGLIEQTHLGETLRVCKPRLMPSAMRDIVFRILDNPFEEKFRHGFYDFSVRELLFHHLILGDFAAPGQLSSRDIAAIHAADAIIARDIGKHYTIPELAKLVNTNAFTLKAGFSQVFGMGVFERLLQRKMDKAKFLLETTDMLILDIAEESGYETVTGFINAFRKHFKMSPREYRKVSRGQK